MTEITRRDVLKRISGTLPALALAESTLLAQNQGAAQDEIPAGDLDNFIGISVILTGHKKSDLLRRLAIEYFRRIDRHLKNVGHENALKELLDLFGKAGAEGPAAQEALVRKLMSDPDYQCPIADYNEMKLIPNPDDNESIRLINEARTLINGWTKVNPYGCDDPAEVVNVQPCDPPKWRAMKDVAPYICQEITAVWYMSAIYQRAAGMINVSVPDGQITPAYSFHYGSAKGYVSSLVWDTVGGHTHPYAQCGGEFGYWQENPEPESA